MIKTDIDKVKDVAKLLLKVPIKNIKEQLFISHPFYSNPIYPDTKNTGKFSKTNGLLMIVSDDKARKEVESQYEELINNSTDVYSIIGLITRPYRMQFYKLIMDYLSPKDYAELASFIWTDCEFPSSQRVITKNQWIKIFRTADKKYLMSSQELEYIDKLPDEFPIYRGVCTNASDANGLSGTWTGLSWTTNPQKAAWFAKRFNLKEQKVLKIEHFKKTDVLAYFDSRGEDEIVADLHMRSKKLNYWNQIKTVDFDSGDIYD